MKSIYKCTFKNKNFDCVICLNADMPDAVRLEKIKHLPILAADGAALRLMKLGITPDFVIGDLDSFFENDLSKNYCCDKIIHLPDQNSNDFEKILNFAICKKMTNCLIIGFHGGELEHTLNNWSVLMKYSNKLNLCLLDRGRYGIPISNSIIFPTKKDEMISLIPQTEVVLTSKNLVWELHREPLKLGWREGARNRSKNSIVHLFIHQGELLLFIDERLPYAPDFSLIEGLINF